MDDRYIDGGRMDGWNGMWEDGWIGGPDGGRERGIN